MAVPAQPHHRVPPQLCGDAQIQARSYTALAAPWHHAGLSVCPGGGCASWLAQRGGGCWWVLQASSEPTAAVSCQKSASPAVGTASRSHQDASLHTNPGDSACPTPCHTSTASSVPRCTVTLLLLRRSLCCSPQSQPFPPAAQPLTTAARSRSPSPGDGLLDVRWARAPLALLVLWGRIHAPAPWTSPTSRSPRAGGGPASQQLLGGRCS